MTVNARAGRSAPTPGWLAGLPRRVSADGAIRFMSDFDACHPWATGAERMALRGLLMERITR